MKGSRSRRWSGKTKIRKRPKQTKRISLPLGSVILTLGLGVPVFTDCTDGDLSTNTSTSLGVDQVMIYLFWRLKSNRLRRCTSNVKEWSRSLLSCYKRKRGLTEALNIVARQHSYDSYMLTMGRWLHIFERTLFIQRNEFFQNLCHPLLGHLI